MTRVVRVLFRVLLRMCMLLWPSASTRRALVRGLRASPPSIQVLVCSSLLVLAWLSGNWFYQVAQKPSELFFPLSGRFLKQPTELWRAYGSSFRKHSTALITPTFLAALAYLESGGDPIARTYWRWQFSSNPLRWYTPASSAVGLYQVTNATFEQMRRYCIHDHQVVETGPWHDMNSCWFNAFYVRALPSHAIEFTSAYLDRQLRVVLDRVGRRRVSPAEHRNLAALIHLCGQSVAEEYAGRGFRLKPGQLCGDHNVADYLNRLNTMEATFQRLARSQRG